MPILSAAVFDNHGKPYEVSKILTDDFLFDKEAYENYSRVFLPITYVLSYALQFAALTALISHTALWHGKDIIGQWRRSWAEIRKKPGPEYEPLPSNSAGNGRPASRLLRSNTTTSEPELEDLMNSEDVHNRLMRRYEDVPIMWYILTGVSMTAIGMFVVEYYPIHLPWYGLLLALSIGAVLFIPIGIVMAITNQQSSLYLICQLICGVAFPGRPVANMVFTTYGYITSTQGLKFSSDLKLGHYMKIPPKILFNLQLSATIVSSLTQIGVLNWMLRFIPAICTPQAINGFTCPIARVHFNGSILWGVVGPVRFFGPGALYRPLVWAFLVGFIAPIIIWLLARNNRKSILRKVNLAVVFGSLSWIPPATGLNFSVWAVVCYVFNYEIRNRKKEWWKKYNMTLSAALDSGLAVGVVVIFFGIVFPGWMSGFKWWGTEVYKRVSSESRDERRVFEEAILMLICRAAIGERARTERSRTARRLAPVLGEFEFDFGSCMACAARLFVLFSHFRWCLARGMDYVVGFGYPWYDVWDMNAWLNGKIRIHITSYHIYGQNDCASDKSLLRMHCFQEAPLDFGRSL